MNAGRVRRSDHDAIVVGAGPNGLAAAITLAQAGWSVQLRESTSTIGGGIQSGELTLPGFVHDVCSAVHPLARSSAFFRTLPLVEHGLDWIEPPVQLAHPFDDGPSALLYRSVDATAETLGGDADHYRALLDPFVANWEQLAAGILAPVHVPRHPLLLARFGLRAIRPAERLAHGQFSGARARGFFAGLAAHSIMPLDAVGTAAFGLVLAVLGHAAGWPVPRGGSQCIAKALAGVLRSLGGEIVTDAPVRTLDDLVPVRATMLDLTPRQVLGVTGQRLPASYRRTLGRYRYGPGVFKMDWALSEPVPWRDADCARAGTLHLGGTLEEIAMSEAAPAKGEIAERPFVLVAQPSVFDSTRAPEGKHTLWGYCHVPNGSTVDMTDRIEAQIERFAPGFRDVIIGRSSRSPRDLEAHNANLIGGDIGGGANTLAQLLFGPTIQRVPYATPVDGLYICSSSTPPRGGVHGLCGYYAARAALRVPGTR